MKTKYSYTAHQQRKGVVHASDDELFVLLGELALVPGKETSYFLEYPRLSSTAPKVTVKFVSKDQLKQYAIDCKEDLLILPPGFEDLPSPELSCPNKVVQIELTDDRPGRWIHRWEKITSVKKSKKDKKKEPGTEPLEINQTEISFKTSAEEGVYIFHVEYTPLTPFASDSFTVAIYNKVPTVFPQNEDDDIGDLLADTVNFIPKNGFLWFAHPIYYTEQLLNIQLSEEIKQDIVSCKDFPPDMPVSDKVLTRLQWGYALTGFEKIRLEVDPDDDVCRDTSKMEQSSREVDFEKILKKLPLDC